MKDVMKKVATFLFYALAVIIYLWTASLTLDLLMMIMPNDPITPFLGLALFDVGALIWLLVFLFNAQGLSQRAVALIGFAVDFIGTVAMVAADLFLSGQNMADVPEFLSNGTPVYILVGATAFNLFLIYVYHITDPNHSKEIEIQTEVDVAAEEGLKEARRQLKDRRGELGGLIANRIMHDALLRLEMHETHDGRVIDAQSSDVGASPVMQASGHKKAKSVTVNSGREYLSETDVVNPIQPTRK
jgi:hypothetical protein